MNKKGAISVVWLVAVLTLCFILKLQVAGADPQKPRLYVDPKDNQFFTKATPIGTNFTVSIKSADWPSPGVFGYQLRLHYNNTVLEAVAASIPTDHWLKPLNASNIVKVDDGTISPQPDPINQQDGCISFCVVLLGEEPGKIGGGVLSTVTFRISGAPPQGENVSSALELKEIIIADPAGEPIPSDNYDIINGNYLLSTADPPGPKEDLNHDGKVNILDMVIVGRAYHSHPGDTRWNPIADLNGDGEINIVDIASIAKAWTW